MKSMRAFSLIAVLALAVGFLALALPGGALDLTGYSASVDASQTMTGGAPPGPMVADLDLSGATIDSPNTVMATATAAIYTDSMKEAVATKADFKMHGASATYTYDGNASSGPPLYFG